MKKSITFVWRLMLLIAISIISLQVKSQNISLTTNLGDYSPGDAVLFNGSGFQPGEIVNVRIEHEVEGNNSINHTHEPFSVTATEAGLISGSWIVPDDVSEVGGFIITTIGSMSGISAVATFVNQGVVIPKPWVNVDMNDYAPGATVVISGAVFQPGETVTLLVAHLDGKTHANSSHLPWSITADQDGKFSSTWLVPLDDLGSKFLLTADGNSSGSHAEVMFLDIDEIPITTFGATYTQNFDVMTASPVTPFGWVFNESGSSANTAYNLGNSTTGDTYSYSSSTTPSDKAFGQLRSGNLVTLIGARFINNTGGTIKTFEISYTGEQWRIGAQGRLDRMDFQYSLDATSLTTGTWVNVDALDFTAPVTSSGGNTSLNGNVAPNRTPGINAIIEVTRTAGQIIWIRWQDLDAAGADDGLAIDDFSLIASNCTEPNVTVTSITNISCNGGNDGAINISVSGGSGSYQYMWSGTGVIVSAEDQSGLGAGNYAVQVSNNDGSCPVTSSVTLTEPPALSITETVTNVNCFNGTTGAIDLSVSGPYNNAVVTENFNTLATSGSSNTTVPAGWAFFETGSNANTSYNGGNSTTGDTYSYGSGTNSERAFGMLQSGSLVSTIGYEYTNNTGTVITSINVSYWGEQWRLGGTHASPDRLDFQYSTNATSLGTGSWTDVNTLDFNAPIITGSGSQLDGNAAANRVFISGAVTGLSIPNGSTVWIRWTDFDISGSDDGLAVDDVNFTFVVPAPVYSYLWSNSATTQDISGVGANTYMVTVKYDGKCPQTKSITITQPLAVSFTATPTQPKCFGEKGSVALSTPTGGTGAITFDATPTTNLGAGSYTYTATDANGCTATQTVTINAAPAAISFTATPTQPKCFGEKGSVVLSTPTGGTGAITFDNTPTTDLGPATYTYTATDANGCTANQTVTINAAPAAISFTATPTQPKCFGDKGSVALSTPTGGTGTITFDATPTTNLSAGSYTYTATDANGCTATQTVTIDAAPSQLIAAASATPVLCNGGTSSLTISASGGTPGYTGTGTFTVYAGPYSYTVTDANGCTATVSGTIGQPSALTASCTNNNSILYFGYTGDQTSTITVKPSGGVGPYKVSITMNRPLACNVITSTGDEVWTAGSNTATSNNITCPGSGSATLNPVSTSTANITTAAGYSINVTLMQDATFTATITDANGCTTTCTSTIQAEDVRCFAGNSGNEKVTICHRTGSTKNPCVKICVDQSAVEEHLAHGDYVGNCTPNCVAPPLSRPSRQGENVDQQLAPELTVNAWPNPAASFFNIVVNSRVNDLITIRVVDVYGKTIQVYQKIGNTSSLNMGHNWVDGAYFIEVTQGKERKVVKVLKTK